MNAFEKDLHDFSRPLTLCRLSNGGIFNWKSVWKLFFGWNIQIARAKKNLIISGQIRRTHWLCHRRWFMINACNLTECWINNKNYRFCARWMRLSQTTWNALNWTFIGCTVSIQRIKKKEKQKATKLRKWSICILHRTRAMDFNGLPHIKCEKRT